MKNEKIAFAERFKELREENKWKKIEVAKLLNCSKSLITEYEQGKKLPRFEMLVKMRKIFRKPVEYIMGEINDTKEIIIYTEAPTVKPENKKKEGQ